jgi:hypothetical protein
VACALLRGVKYGYISEVVGGPTVNRPSIRRLALPPLLRGALVVVIGVGVSTCRIGDLINGPAAAILEVIPSLPDSLVDSAALGATAHRLNRLQIKNLGGGELTWQADKRASSPWLSFQPESGKAGDPMMVVLNPDSLAEGSYSDTVVITAPSGIAKTPVRFWVHPCRPLPINYADSPSDSVNSADCGAPHRTGKVHADLYSFNGTIGDTASVVVTPQQFNGFVALDSAPFTPGVAPLATTTDCHGDVTSQCIYYFILPKTRQYFLEVSGATTNDSGPYSLELVHVGRLPNLPDSLDQRQLDSTHSIAPGSTTGASVLLRAVVSDSDVVDTLHLEAEVQRITDPFGNSANVPPGPEVDNGKPAWLRLSGLTDQTCYHWQVRVKDQTGRPSGWKPNGGNPDFCVQLGQNPNPPTNLVQLQSDGSTIIPVGGNANSTTMKFSAQVNDPDLGDQLHIEVEVQPTDTAFTNNPSQNQTFVASGNPGTTTTTIIAPTIVDGKNYHWHARTVDQTNRKSGWVSYPTPTPNLETATDFHVAVQNNNNLAFTVQPPAQVTAGIAMSPAVQVTAQDPNGQTISGFTGNVQMSIASGPPGGAFSPRSQTVVAAVAGVANFPNLILTKVGTYTLQASAVFSGTTVLSPASTPTVVVAAPAKQLTFTAGPPGSAQAGTAITPLTVSALDSLGNVASSFTGQVALSITSGTGKTGAHLLGTTTVSASAGVATFTTVNIDSTGTGYTLTAAATGLTSGTSAAFNITPGPATHLVFAVPPSTTVANSPITPAVQVAARDAFENTATSFTGSVTIAIGTNPAPGGGVLSSGTPNPANAVSGFATFSSLSIDKVANGYTLTASATSLTGATSGPFNIVNSNVSPTLSSVAATSPITVCQTGCSTGAGTASLVTVTVRDLGNQPVAGATVVLSAPGASFTQPGLTNASGITTGTMTSTVAQVVSVTAVANGVTISTQPPVTVNPGQPASLAFTPGPNNTTAGVAINNPTGVGVTVRDQFGNTVTSFTNAVSMAIASGPSTFTPTSTTSLNATAGVAMFTNLHIQVASSYTIKASIAVPLLSVTSSPFNITAAPPFQLMFTTQPQNTAVLARIDSGNAQGGVVVTVQDSVGNTTPFGGTVRILVGNPGTNPGGGTLSGGSAIPAATGIATFPNLTLNALGTGYTLQTTSSGPVLQPDESTPFNIVPGPAKSLVFSAQPTTTIAGTTITPAVTVTAKDVQGNTATGFSGNVTVAIGSNPGGGTLSGTKIVAAVAGTATATFSDLSINSAGTGYTLAATTPALPSGPVTGATSTAFDIVPGGVSPITSTIVPSPTTITACKTGCAPGTTATSILVTAKDGLGNALSGLTVTLSTNGNGDAITQPATVTDVNGQTTGTINDTTVEVVTVRATIGSTLINAAPTVSVSAAAPAVLAWLSAGQPRDTTAGAALRAPGGLQVRIQDQFHNNVPGATNSVGISILIPPSPNNGATLSGSPNPKAAVNGVATFTNLSIDKVGTTPYQLLATGLPTTDTSQSFSISAGAATQLSIATQPSTSAQSGIAIPQQPAVQLLDAFNNPVNQSGVVVTAALATGSGSLTNATMSTNASGLATFSGLAINGVVGSYTLKFTTTSPSLTSPNSNSISLSAGSASKLGFFTQPVATTGGIAIPTTVQVEIEDASGNRVTSASATIQMALGTNPKNGHLTGTTSAGTASGVASFSNLVIDSAATGYTLSATGGGFTAATSSAFNVTVGSATKLGYRVAPSTTNGGATMTTVQVEIRDAGGNRVTTASRNITLAITTNPNSGTLSGTLTNPTSSGLASFSDLSIDSAGTGYVIQATASGGPALTPVSSSGFNITVGPAAQLIYLVQPSDPQSDGVAITPAIQVEVADLGGNRVTSSSATIGIDFGTNAGGALSGTLSVQAVSGVASFGNVIITGPASGYTLVATSTGLTGTGPSNPFTVN